MPILLSNEEQDRSITPAEVIEAFDAALEQFSRGDAMRRPRIDNLIATSDPDTWFEFSSMEGGQRDGYYGLRVKPNMMTLPVVNGLRRIVTYNVTPGMFGGLVFLFDSRTAEFLAILNDGYIQHARVAAATALGIKWLARKDAKVLGVYGSGGMAEYLPVHAQEVRDLERLQVYSPNRANLDRYCELMAGKLKMEIVPVDRPEDVCAGADIVLGCTNSLEPVLKGEWVEPGTHLSNVLPGEFGMDTYARVDVEGFYLDRTPMSIAGLVDDDFGHRIQVMSWIAGTPEERAHLEREFPSGVQQVNRCSNARGVVCHDWTTDESYADVRKPEEITYLAAYGNGFPEGDAATSSGPQGIQFSSVGGAIYERAKRLGLGTSLGPLEAFQQTIPT